MDLLIEDYRVDLNILKLINECFDEMTSIINDKPKFISSKEYTKLCLDLVNLYSNFKLILNKANKTNNTDITQGSKINFIQTHMTIIMAYAPIILAGKYDAITNNSDNLNYNLGSSATDDTI